MATSLFAGLMILLRTVILLLALLLPPAVAAKTSGDSSKTSSAQALEDPFADARLSWERSLSTNAERLPHLVDFGPGRVSLAINGSAALTGTFALPRSADPFDPLAPPSPYPPNPISGIMAIPADIFFRTGNPGEPTLQPLPTSEGWASIEADNPAPGLKTLQSLSQIGLATITPIPEPDLPALAGLALIGALLRRQRPSRP